MLHSQAQRPMTGCSKGAWGLFVLPRGLGILTETAISPSTWSRQCPSRYAIRAGRNLPDKEFRYLRTVIVRSEEHTSELQSRQYLVCRLLLEKKKQKIITALNNS